MEILFENNPAIPKYRKIIDAIMQGISTGEIKKGDRIPSLNMLCRQYGLSQDTVLTAYNELKAKGVITSQVGKGYYIQNTNVGLKHNVLLLFDRLTAYKEELYHSFKDALGSDGREQIFFHHNNLKMFKTILENSGGEFSEFVIMPIDHADAVSIISGLPQDRVFILDQGREKYKKLYPYVCQDFERDIYRILKEHFMLVDKYKRMVLVIRNLKSHFREISKGFRDYCKSHPVKAEVVTEIYSFRIKQGDAFIVVDDRDLEFLVRYSIENKLRPGKDIGIISYNETPLKGIISSGITTISTDFSHMGRLMAQMILQQQRLKKDNPFLMVRRSSF